MRPDDVCDVNFQEIYLKNRTPDDVCDVNFQEIFLIFIYLEMTDNQFNWLIILEGSLTPKQPQNLGEK